MPLITETMIFAALAGLFLFFLIMIEKKSDPQNQFFYARLWSAGILLILGVTATNSIVENRWSYDYILEFLFLKEVGKWSFRILAGLGYIFVVVSSITLLAFVLKSIIRKRNQNII